MRRGEKEARRSVVRREVEGARKGEKRSEKEMRRGEKEVRRREEEVRREFRGRGEEKER